MKEKKDPAILAAFLSLVLPLFLRCNPRFPLAYKRKSKAPHKGIQIGTRPNHEIKTPEHDTSTRLSSDRALSIRSFLSPETWDPFPLSPVYNPTTNQVLVTQAAVN